MAIKKQSTQREIKPIPDLAQLHQLRKMLQNKPRDLLLFDLATQTGASLKALLQMKVKDLWGLQPGDPIQFADGFSKKDRSTIMDRIINKTFQYYIDRLSPEQNDYLFVSRKGKEPLSMTSASHLIRNWFTEAGIEGLAGAKSLRKTWETFFHPKLNMKEELPEIFAPTAVLQPVNNSTIQETVYQRLLKAIVSGKIPPGQKLTALEITKQMQVSLMPVREAMHRLQAAGFIILQKKRGSIVAELSRENLEEITEIRLILELKASALGALNADPVTVKYLDEVNNKCSLAKKKADVDRCLAFNKEFHHTIYGKANKPILMQIIEGLWDRVSPYFHIFLRETKISETDWMLETHQGILEGMKKNDAKQVVDFMRADIGDGSKQLLDLFDQLRDG